MPRIPNSFIPPKKLGNVEVSAKERKQLHKISINPAYIRQKLAFWEQRLYLQDKRFGLGKPPRLQSFVTLPNLSLYKVVGLELLSGPKHFIERVTLERVYPEKFKTLKDPPTQKPKPIKPYSTKTLKPIYPSAKSRKSPYNPYTKLTVQEAGKEPKTKSFNPLAPLRQYPSKLLARAHNPTQLQPTYFYKHRRPKHTYPNYTPPDTTPTPKPPTKSTKTPHHATPSPQLNITSSHQPTTTNT